MLRAIVINILFGASFATAVLIWGRPLHAAMGGDGASLRAALTYSNIVFGGNVLLWMMNGLASVIRGTGNMLMPALVIFTALASCTVAVPGSDFRSRSFFLGRVATRAGVTIDNSVAAAQGGREPGRADTTPVAMRSPNYETYDCHHAYGSHRDFSRGM